MREPIVGGEETTTVYRKATVSFNILTMNTDTHCKAWMGGSTVHVSTVWAKRWKEFYGVTGMWSNVIKLMNIHCNTIVTFSVRLQTIFSNFTLHFHSASLCTIFIISEILEDIRQTPVIIMSPNYSELLLILFNYYCVFSSIKLPFIVHFFLVLCVNYNAFNVILYCGVIKNFITSQHQYKYQRHVEHISQGNWPTDYLFVFVPSIMLLSAMFLVEKAS